MPKQPVFMAFAALCGFLSGGMASAKERPPVRTYKSGVIIGWSQTSAASSTTPVRGAYGGVRPRLTTTYGRKVYELQGVGMTYTLNNCGKFQPKQAVQYRTNGDWLYISKNNKGNEYKCMIMGAKAESSPTK